MSHIDDSETNRHKSSRKRSSSVKPYINTYITLFQFISSKNDNQQIGQFIFTLQPTGGADLITIYQQGSSPYLSFPLDRKISWRFQNKVYCYMNDPSGNQWLLQFNDTKSAAYATATIALHLHSSYVNEFVVDEIIHNEGKGISIGDTVLLSYFCFEFQENLFVGNLIASAEGLKTEILKEKISQSILNGLIGMAPGGLRAIFIPSGFNPNDTLISKHNLVVIAEVTKVKYNDDAHTSISEVSDTDIAVIPQKTGIPSSNPKSDTQSESEETHDHKSKKAIPPIINEEAISERDLSILDAKLDSLHNRICSSIKDHSYGESAPIISGILFMNKNLSDKKSEINALRSRLEDMKKKPQIPLTEKKSTNDGDDLKLKKIQLDRRIKESNERIAQLERELVSSQRNGIAKGKDMIKKVMSAVFDEFNESIEESKKYSGSDVSSMIFKLFRKHSFSVFEEINNSGIA